METPYVLNSEEGSAYSLGYMDCQFGVDKHSNPFVNKDSDLAVAYKRGYEDCAEFNFGNRKA